MTSSTLAPYEGAGLHTNYRNERHHCISDWCLALILVSEGSSGKSYLLVGVLLFQYEQRETIPHRKDLWIKEIHMVLDLTSSTERKRNRDREAERCSDLLLRAGSCKQNLNKKANLVLLVKN